MFFTLFDDHKESYAAQKSQVNHGDLQMIATRSMISARR
jgi:hypothetical protein